MNLEEEKEGPKESGVEVHVVEWNLSGSDQNKEKKKKKVDKKVLFYICGHVIFACGLIILFLDRKSVV